MDVPFFWPTSQGQGVDLRSGPRPVDVGDASDVLDLADWEPVSISTPLPSVCVEDGGP